MVIRRKAITASIITAVCLIVSIAIIVIILNGIQTEISIHYKNSEANYGDYSVFYHGNVYFQHNNKIYCISNDLSMIGKINYGLELFSIDHGNVYLKNNNRNLKIYSSDLNCKNIRLRSSFYFKPGYSDHHTSYSYDVINGNIIAFFESIDVLQNDSFVSPTTQGMIQLQADDKTFILYKGENEIYIRPNDITHVTGVLNKANNVFVTYRQDRVGPASYFPYIFTINGQPDRYFVLADYNLYQIIGNNIKKVNRLRYGYHILFSAEDNNYIYVATSTPYDDKQDIYKIKKDNGTAEMVNEIDNANHGQYIALTDKYYVVYKDGYIDKINIENKKIISSIKIMDKKYISINIEFCGDYLFINKNSVLGNVLNIYNIESMKKVDIKD